MNILVTGGAGFIGYHVSKMLLSQGHNVTILDSFDPYYSKQLKFDRIKELRKDFDPTVIYDDFTQRHILDAFFTKGEFEKVFHLGGQAGVTYSVQNPKAYLKANVVGSRNIFDCCKKYGINQIIAASSSSIYGNSTEGQSSETSMPNPMSYYAETKMEMESMLSEYRSASLITNTMRLFTVYGEWGRPDMSYWKFADAIINRQPITVYPAARDFTHCHDTAIALVSMIEYGKSSLMNIGNEQPVQVIDMIKILGELLEIEPIINNQPLPSHEPTLTYSDCSYIRKQTGFQAQINIRDGLAKFVDWYKSYAIAK